MDSELQLGKLLQPSVHIGEVTSAPRDAIASLAKAIGKDVESLSTPLSSEEAEILIGSEVVDSQAAMDGLRVISNRRTI